MPDLLLELFSEEIPARMQAGAARDLERLMVGALTDRGFLFEGIKAFGGPRRLTLAITGLPAQQKDVREELKGPKVDAPPAAIEGFLKKTGLTREQLKVETTPKGDVYIAVIERKGRETPLVLAEIIPDVMGKFPWPKSMRWPQGAGGFGSGGFGVGTFGGVIKWVRPLRSILCTFDGELIQFHFGGISSGLHTLGHRFLSQGKIEAKRFEDYEQKLRAAHAILDAEERAAIIFEGIKQAAFVHGLEMIPDEGLLAEVAGLAEYPVVLIGRIEDQFMDVPAEILQTSMRTHQKYFSLRDPKTGKMANRFALVANMVASDGGKEIVAGNERVLRARLSDAQFFWFMDLQKKQEYQVIELADVVFHAKLGSQFARTIRLSTLAGLLAKPCGAEKRLCERAGWLSKTDLLSGVVGEFPELQGVMGYYYALNNKEARHVAEALRDQYKPLGPGDSVPVGATSISVALADKIDLLAGFFSVGERPSGSGDPFALRRAALGLIRTVLESKCRLPLKTIFETACSLVGTDVERVYYDRSNKTSLGLIGTPEFSIEERKSVDATLDQLGVAATVSHAQPVVEELLSFITDRLKVALKEKGTRHDLIDAVFSLGNEDDLVRLVARVEALQAFLRTDDGKSMLAGYKRAANILKAEEKKDGKLFTSEVLESHLPEPAEQFLFAALTKTRAAIAPLLADEQFAAAMQQMAALRVPVDAFFEGVKVNADDKQVRENRLNLLASLRATLHQVADFSKIEG